MKYDKNAYRDIRVEDQRDDKGARARKGLDYQQRYIDAAIDYIRRNPTAPNTALDEEDLRKFREQQERERIFGTGPNKGIPIIDPFQHAKSLRSSEAEMKLKAIFDFLFTPPNSRKK